MYKSQIELLYAAMEKMSAVYYEFQDSEQSAEVEARRTIGVAEDLIRDAIAVLQNQGE